MRQYAIDRVEATWAALDLKEGLAQGTSISEVRNAPTYTQKPTGTGRTVRVRNPDKSGQLEIIVDQESQTHQNLRQIMQVDDVSRNQVFPFVITDTSTGEVFVYNNAFIMSEPEETRGTDSTTFTWIFGFETFAKTAVPSLTANIVGD